MAKGNGGTRTNSDTKSMQLAIINASNPMRDDYHVGIRSISDIKTFSEALEYSLEENGGDSISVYPDVTDGMLRDAQRSGKIVVYSSKPIEDGAFVSPSRMMAQDYAGSNTVFSKEVNVSDVAWINADEGQFAKIKIKRK